METYKSKTKVENYKVCRKCLSPKRNDDFKPREKNRLTSWCADCLKVYKHDDHQKYKSRDQEKKSHRISKNRMIIWDYFKNHPCVDCGESNPLVLELDHVRGTKIGDVTRMATNGVGEVFLRAEISKCDSRCANCHRKKTIKSTPNHWRVRLLETLPS